MKTETESVKLRRYASSARRAVAQAENDGNSRLATKLRARAHNLEILAKLAKLGKLC